MQIDLKLFYIEVFVQVIIFFYVCPRKVKPKIVIKILNQFIQYFNAPFWFKPCECKVSRWKIQKSSLASWLFRSQWPIIWTLTFSCVPLWLHKKKWSINFSCLNARLSSPFSLILDLHLLNLATVNAKYCLRHIYHVNK